MSVVHSCPVTNGRNPGIENTVDDQTSVNHLSNSFVSRIDKFRVDRQDLTLTSKSEENH